MITNKELKKRILEISFKHKLSHLGSNLTAVDIIKEIYDIKKPEEKFILSSGHAGLALYVVLEKIGRRDAEYIYLHHGVHPDRCTDCGLDCSTGSLGQGIAISVGLALANRNRNVYTLCSDGESFEGSFWESLQVARDQKLTNLKVYLNCNSWAAYRGVDADQLEKQVTAFGFPVNFVRTTNEFPFLEGQSAHYVSLSENDYNLATQQLGTVYE